MVLILSVYDSCWAFALNFWCSFLFCFLHLLGTPFSDPRSLSLWQRFVGFYLQSMLLFCHTFRVDIQTYFLTWCLLSSVNFAVTFSHLTPIYQNITCPGYKIRQRPVVKLQLWSSDECSHSIMAITPRFILTCSDCMALGPTYWSSKSVWDNV